MATEVQPVAIPHNRGLHRVRSKCTLTTVVNRESELQI